MKKRRKRIKRGINLNNDINYQIKLIRLKRKKRFKAITKKVLKPTKKVQEKIIRAYKKEKMDFLTTEDLHRLKLFNRELYNKELIRRYYASRSLLNTFKRENYIRNMFKALETVENRTPDLKPLIDELKEKIMKIPTRRIDIFSKGSRAFLETYDASEQEDADAFVIEDMLSIVDSIISKYGERKSTGFRTKPYEYFFYE